MSRGTPKVQDGVLFQDKMPSTDATIVVGTTVWYSWLECQSSFRFACLEGTFTARKERRADSWYWYAYRRQKGRLHTVYMGKSDDLTLIRLSEIAQLMTLECASTDGEGAAQSVQSERVLDQDELLITKLSVPPVRSSLVARQRLVTQLDAGLGSKLILVTGPAGFGKTTLLSNWLHSCSSHSFPIAWLSLDAGDNDPVRFWTYVIAALQKLQAGIAEHVLTMLPSVQTRSLETLMTAFINALATLPGDVVLVFDDYHVIDAQPIHEAITFLLDYMPPQFHLVLASRSEPPFPLARLRARCHMIELTANDLRFSRDEAEAFFHDVMNLKLSNEDISALAQRTEGWIAGLHMVSIALQGRQNVSQFVNEFQGNHRYILDYLANEVLQKQPEHIQQFLLQTSILDRFNGSLCDAVTDQKNSQILIEQLEQANLFLVGLDDKRYWYRYHQLFVEFLYERLCRTSPDTMQALHHRAAQWHIRHGLTVEAIRHALAASEFSLAAYLIQKMAQTMLMRREVTTLLGWLAALPDSIVQDAPHLSLVYAWALIHANQLEAVEQYLLHAENALEAGKVLGEIPNMRGEIAAIRARVTVFQGESSRTIELSQQALALLPEKAMPLRGEAALNLGIAYISNGDATAASQAFVQARDISETAGNLRTAMLAVRYLAQVQVDQGLLHQAAEMYQQGLNVAHSAGETMLPPLGFMHVGLGELLYEWNRLDEATSQLEEAIERGQRGGDVKIWLMAYLLLAKVKHALGDHDSVNSIFERVEGLIRQANFTRARLWLETDRALLEIAKGNVAAAANWVQMCGLDIEAQPTFALEYDYFILARMLLALGKTEKAIRIASQLLCMAEEKDRTGVMISNLTLLAAAYEVANNAKQAMHVLGRALSLAEPQGYVRTFVNEGIAVERVLKKMRKAYPVQQRNGSNQGWAFSLGYIDTLLAAFGNTQSVSENQFVLVHNGRPLQPLLESLSGRELEVLQLIATGQSNREIAQQLIVGMNTVKTHVKSIYAKLDVHSRTQALVRAQTLRLL
ncbi:MAG TPA: LuxR C-terminal-related transcriptional regulator [Ktedonobacteraceae bacterium]|nr:LuxR C-terminal-related transcriptional regulator [Ktedonobacteraceae bacterium]